MTHQLLAEVMSTALMIIFGVGVHCDDVLKKTKYAGTGHLFAITTWAFGITVCLFVFGGVSMNPAMALLKVLLGKLTIAQFFPIAIAEMIGAKSNEIYFTGGGSESDNWALKCTAEAYANKGNHIITTKIEHHAILHTAEYLEKRGFEVTYLDVDEDGKVKLDDLKAAIRPTTILISVMFANNEIGTIQPIREIGEIAHEHGILFHTDAVQAFGQLPINVDECHIDMLSASGHKFNGPKGIGIMYIRTGVKIRSFIHGGAQERKRRAGTENVPGIVGIGTAAKRAAANMEERTAKEREVRDYLIDRVLNEIPYCRLNGHRTDRLPNNANFSFQFVEGESLLIKLDMKGICGSSGSACTSGSLDPSHVLLAIGLPHEIAHGSLRLTLNEEIEKEDIRCRIEAVRSQVGRTHPVAPFGFDVLVHGFRRIILKAQIHTTHFSCLGIHLVGRSPKLASDHAACIQAPSQAYPRGFLVYLDT